MSAENFEAAFTREVMAPLGVGKRSQLARRLYGVEVDGEKALNRTALTCQAAMSDWFKRAAWPSRETVRAALTKPAALIPKAEIESLIERLYTRPAPANLDDASSPPSMVALRTAVPISSLDDILKAYHDDRISLEDARHAIVVSVKCSLPRLDSNQKLDTPPLPFRVLPKVARVGLAESPIGKIA